MISSDLNQAVRQKDHEANLRAGSFPDREQGRPGKPIVMICPRSEGRDGTVRYPHDTFGGSRLYPIYKTRHVEANLLNAACSDLYREYASVCANLLLPRIATPLAETGKVVSNGSSGVDAMVSCARRYQELLGAAGTAVMCSTGAHSSVQAAGRGQTVCIPLTAPHGQLDAKRAVRELREKKPALVVLTLGRTDDGGIEMLPRELSKACCELRIPVGLDLSLGGLIGLLPDSPAFPGDNSYHVKMCWESVIRDPAVKFMVAGFGKIMGSPGTECLFALGADKALKQAIDETFHIQEKAWNYFQSPHGFYNTTTQPSACVEETVETLKRIGVWGLRYFAVHAKHTAHEVGSALRNGGVDVLPVTMNALTLPLASYEQAAAVQQWLWNKQRVSVALTKSFPGVRVVFNFGVYYTKAYRARLANALGASVQDEGQRKWKKERMEEPLYGLVQFRCTRDIIARLQPLYRGTSEIPVSKDRSSVKAYVAKAYEGLSLLRAEHDIPAYGIIDVLKSLGRERYDSVALSEKLVAAIHELASSVRKHDDLPRALCLHMCRSLCDSLYQVFARGGEASEVKSKAIVGCLQRFIDATGTLRNRYLNELAPLPRVA